MIGKFTQRFSYLGVGVRTGIGLGLVLIFLTLIGIPSSDSQQLARLTLPIFFLLALWLGWRTASKNSEQPTSTVVQNGAALGLAAAVVLLLFLGLINRWQANGINVTRDYFYKMDAYPLYTLSGVPVNELIANPSRDPITGEYPEGAQLRTTPMKLYLSQDYALVSLLGLHVGGLYGLALLLAVSAGLGSTAQRLSTRVDWGAVRARIRSYENADVAHWLILLAPALFFALFWMTIPQSIGGSRVHILPLRQILNLTSGSLVDEVGLQMGISFLVIITAIIAIRRATTRPYALSYAVRVGLSLAAIVLFTVLAIVRMQGNNVTFFAPSYDILDLSGHDMSLIALVLGALVLAYYAIRAQRDETRFEFVFTAIISLAAVVISPLYMDQYQTFILGRVGLSIMFGLGLNIVIGYAGLLDLGYVAFYAMGAYMFAFLAIENDRSKFSIDQLNNLGWGIVTAMIVAPLVIFALTNLWHRRTATQPTEKRPRIQHQSRVWNQQPPRLVALGMVVLAVVVVLLVRELLIAAGVFAADQFSSFLIAIVVAMVVAAFTGVALGIPVLRLRGDYLAIVTLGFGEIISLGLKNLDNVTGGPSGAIGIPRPVAAGTPVPTTNLVMLYLSIVGAVLIVLLSSRLRHSRLGRAWLAMHSDEDIAQAMGINLVNVKLLAFSIGASFAGLAGMMFASRQNSIFPDDFGLEISIHVLSLVIIGGMGSIPGVIVGSIALIGLPELLRPIADYRIMAFGMLLIVTMIVLPGGLMPSPPPELEAEAKRLAEELDPEGEMLR